MLVAVQQNHPVINGLLANLVKVNLNNGHKWLLLLLLMLNFMELFGRDIVANQLISIISCQRLKFLFLVVVWN